MTKPGNMPVDKWTWPLLVVGFALLGVALAFIASGLLPISLWFFFSAWCLASLSAISRSRHDRRVRKYLHLVCFLALCVFAGGCGDSNRLDWAEAEIKQLKRDRHDTRVELNKIHDQLRQPTQSLPGPTEELLPEPQPNVEKRLQELGENDLSTIKAIRNEAKFSVDRFNDLKSDIADLKMRLDGLEKQRYGDDDAVVQLLPEPQPEKP